MPLPDRLAGLVEAMASAPREVRLEALLDYSRRVPPLPPGMSPEDLETVPECQTPFLLAVTLDVDGKVHMSFDAPPESPTVRGFAGILYAGLEGEDAATVLAVSDDFVHAMGIDEIITPLRLRGLSAILTRLKRQVAEQLATR